MKITTLIENVVYSPDLVAEHGLSFLIDTGDLRILFDTGQSGKFVDNAKLLSENLTDIDYLIFSHGHYDHTGGLKSFLEINNTAKIILKNSALENKYSNSKGNMREIGFNLRNKYLNYPNKFIFLDEDFSLNKDIEIITTINKTTDFENDESNLFTKSDNNYVLDNFIDELFLIIKKDTKIDIITGCSHNGIINIIRTAIQKSNKDIDLLLGGAHLKGKSKIRIEKTRDELQKNNIERLMLNHCTGIEEFCYLKEKFGRKLTYCYTGMCVEL